MNITLVPPGQVSGLVPSLLPYLQESEKWTRGRALADDILRMILTGHMLLWVVYDSERVYGHVITETKDYPRCKMLTVQYCAGEHGHMAEIEDKTMDTLERFAKDAGCAGIEFVGRPGWRRTANKFGYDVQSVMYQKFFGETK